MKYTLLLTTFFVICALCSYSQAPTALEDSLYAELNTIIYADFITEGNKFLNKIPSAPSYMICSEYDSLAFQHLDIIPDHRDGLNPTAEAITVYAPAEDGRNNFGVNKVVFLQIYSEEFLNFNSLRVGQNYAYIKDQLQQLIVHEVKKEGESELILSTDNFNIIIWHDQSEILMIRLQRKC